MHKVFHKLESRIDDLGNRLGNLFTGEKEPHAHTHDGVDCSTAHGEEHNDNRFQSFAPQTTGQAKWHVDGCAYFWALSEALERAQSTIYILDWWLSPELYLRRPPAKHEQYRLDRMLQAAAERGVQVRIIVYKEVTQALTLCSYHTKHALEALHPNIRVLRHPDHLPSGNELRDDVRAAFKNMGSLDLAKLGKDAQKTLYGTSDDVVLYWAHHEKLCIVDNELVFMGGLDACFGRWDTNSHPIADAHPGDLDAIMFPGQDYNNARIYDFSEVNHWEQNKLDRTKYSRMGWSDISISLSGPIVHSLLAHFVDRWNYIYNGKYLTRKDYSAIDAPEKRHHVPDSFRDGMRRLMDTAGVSSNVTSSVSSAFKGAVGGFGHHNYWSSSGEDALHIQLTRSCTAWSSGHPTEHSIANAYMDTIARAEHFIYMENQFFITATSDEQRPVGNKIGRAIVDRIVRAHKEGTPFAVIVCMPAVPGFAGDLHDDSALGTRAIMEFQYNSISRGGHSICEALVAAGVEDPGRYIRFYNLRNYDRINTAAMMGKAEDGAHVSYGAAHGAADDATNAAGTDSTNPGAAYHRYQDAAADAQHADPSLARTADSVASAYMAGGDLHKATWVAEGGADADADAADAAECAAYVSEELYIHSKVLIADDRIVLCGSANLNDRSQLGSHDSEIVAVIEDPAHPVHTTMAGQPWVASAFAASLRRQLFRKHVGLLPDQIPDRPDQNFHPVSVSPNAYDWDSPEDRLVADPLADGFQRFWTSTARTNTAAFDDVFHCVPTDHVRSWKDYDEYFARHFVMPGSKEEKEGKTEEGKAPYGHVWPGFEGGAKAVKARLAEVRGNLVEMPLQFLVDVPDLAEDGLALNSLTAEIYT